MLVDNSGTIAAAGVPQDLWAASSAGSATVAFIQNTSRYNVRLTVLIDNGANPPVVIVLAPADSIDHTIFGLDAKIRLMGDTAGMSFTAFRR